MSTTVSTAPIDLEELAHAISQAHPAVGFRAIRDEVDRVAPRYADATVVDFLPVLIEREVRGRLRW